MLAAALVATPVLVGGAPAAADTASTRTHSAHAKKATPSSDRRRARSGGIETRLRRVPAEFVAGADWQEFDLVLKNVTEKDLSDFTMDIQVITHYPDAPLHPSHMSVQAMSDSSWEDLELWDMGPQDVDVLLPVDGMKLVPGETVIPLRMKFSGDAPSVKFFLGPQADEDHAEAINEDYWESAWIVRGAAPGPGPGPSADPEPSTDPDPSSGPSSDPAPDPSADPSAPVEPSRGPTQAPTPGSGSGPSPGADPGAATASAHPHLATESAPPGTGLSGAASASGDRLARTGNGAANTVVLGIGGALLLLGALLAVAGRLAARRGGPRVTRHRQ